MSNLVPTLLPIHVVTAIVAFGPNFAMPIIARMAAQEPQHGLFALRLTERLERRLVIPLALTMPISGGALALAEGINPLVTHWLGAAILLYIVAMTYAIGVQVRVVERMIEIAGHMAASGPVLAAGPGAALATAQTLGYGATVPTVVPQAAQVRTSKYANPGQEMAALGVRARNGGFLLMAMVIVIVSLMAGKPAI
jgi:hypothetical protein